MESPRILHMHWGEIETEAGTFRDAKLWPGGGCNWDWNEAGTSHSSGIQTDDLAELIENKIEYVILGIGQNERLQVKNETLRHLHKNNIEVETLNSKEAVERYNELVEREERVGALIHTTC